MAEFISIIVSHFFCFARGKFWKIAAGARVSGGHLCEYNEQKRCLSRQASNARVSGGHLCEYNEQKRCPSRQASNASPRPTICERVLL